MPRPVSSQLFSLMKGMLEKDVELRWDIEKIVQDSWVNLSVDPNNYSFTKIVRCCELPFFMFNKFINNLTSSSR